MGTIWNSCINGTLCIETNSLCEGGICECREGYYGKAGRCSECDILKPVIVYCL